MTSLQILTAKNFLSPLDSAIQTDTKNTLGSVLSLVRSSHEAIFVFNQQNEYQGVVAPYRTLYSSNYPYTTKVTSILFKPPVITADTPIYEVAEHMLSKKLYTLPVFDNDGTLKSVINAKTMLQKALETPELLDFISNQIHPHTPPTVPITASVRDVFYSLREKGFSRAVAVNEGGGIVGIVTRSDLMRSLIKPTSKMRFPSEGSHVGFYSLAGEKKFRKEEPIRKYYTALVYTLPNTSAMKKMVSQLFQSSYNSVVLVDKHKRPTGILSIRDLLQSVTHLRPEEEIPLIVTKPHNSVSENELGRAIEYLQEFGQKLKRRMAIEKIEVATKGPKNIKGEPKVFNTTLIVTPITGKSFVAKTKQENFLNGIQQATTLIEKQRKRSGMTKTTTQYAQL